MLELKIELICRQRTQVSTNKSKQLFLYLPCEIINRIKTVVCLESNTKLSFNERLLYHNYHVSFFHTALILPLSEGKNEGGRGRSSFFPSKFKKSHDKGIDRV